jgi:hypothetical protein
LPSWFRGKCFHKLNSLIIYMHIYIGQRTGSGLKEPLNTDL